MPPVAGTPDDPRRARIAEASHSFDIFKVMEGVHPFDVDAPEEDFPIFKKAFVSWSFTAQFRVPDYARWLAANGSGDAYAFHRRTVQYYTWQRRQVGPGRVGQWLFKMPFHLMELETLLETYPDAFFIQTHRAPTQVMGSWNSLVERARSVAMKPLPRDDLGAEQLAFMSGMLNGAARFRSAHPELEHRWADVAYADLIRDPIAVVGDLYGRFGWPLPQTAVAAMNAWLSGQAERRRREVRHRYRLEDYGLTPDEVDAAFAPYREFAEALGIPAALPAKPLRPRRVASCRRRRGLRMPAGPVPAVRRQVGGSGGARFARRDTGTIRATPGRALRSFPRTPSRRPDGHPAPRGARRGC